MNITWGDFGQEIEIDGITYLPKWQLKKIESRGNAEEIIHFDASEPYNKCDKCHRADWREVTANSFDDAIERGILIPVADYHQAPGRCPGCSETAGEFVNCSYGAG